MHSYLISSIRKTFVSCALLSNLNIFFDFFWSGCRFLGLLFYTFIISHIKLQKLLYMLVSSLHIVFSKIMLWNYVQLKQSQVQNILFRTEWVFFNCHTHVLWRGPNLACLLVIFGVPVWICSSDPDVSVLTSLIVESQAN